MADDVLESDQRHEIITTELTGAQIETLRTGLQKAFPDSANFEIFLSEQLEHKLYHYVGPNDPIPVAYFRVITQAVAEGWAALLAFKTQAKFKHNTELTRIAVQLRDGIKPSEEEEAEAQAANTLWRDYNPYHAMDALQEHDADFLFGRDRDIDAFIEAMATDQSKILLALGASGVGKSSLILAGIFGALNRRTLKSGRSWPTALETSRTWPHLILAPGTEPVRSLAGAFVRQWLHPTDPDYRQKTNDWRKLLIDDDDLGGLIEAADQVYSDKQQSPPQRYVIYVDQGEELYTRGGREPGYDGTKKETPQQKEARRFSELLAGAATHDRLIVLMSARSDFLGKLQADQPIFDRHRKLDIRPLTEDDIAAVVREPAAKLGVTFENALDDALIAATREEPGGLPLLSYTLQTLWSEMQERGKEADHPDPTLRWQQPAPQGINIAEKLGKRADDFLKAHRDQEPVIRSLFCVDLAHVPQQGAPTRLTVRLDSLSEEKQSLVAKLAAPDQRILVTQEENGQAMASVAHEALFRAWPTLSTWLADHDTKPFYVWITQIAQQFDEFKNIGPSALLKGYHLSKAKAYLEIRERDIPGEITNFIRGSIEAQAEEKTEREEARKRQEEAELKAALAAKEHAEHATLLARRLMERTVAGLGIAIIAAAMAIIFWLDAREARDDALRRESQYLAETARRKLIEKDPLRATLLAIEAVPDASANNQRPYLKDAHTILYESASRLNFRSSGNVAAESVLTGRPFGRKTTPRQSARLASVALLPEEHFAAGYQDGRVLIWSYRNNGGPLHDVVAHTGRINSLIAISDGRIVSASSDRTISIIDAQSGHIIKKLFGHDDEINTLSVSLDGEVLVSGSYDRSVIVWDLENFRKVHRYYFDSSVFSVALFPNKKKLVVTTRSSVANVIDIETGRNLFNLSDHQSVVISSAISRDGNYIITGSYDETAKIWDGKRGSLLSTLKGHRGTVFAVNINENGNNAITSASDGSIKYWDRKSAKQLFEIKDHKDLVNDIAMNSDGSKFVLASFDGTASIWTKSKDNIVDLKCNPDINYSEILPKDYGSKLKEKCEFDIGGRQELKALLFQAKRDVSSCLDASERKQYGLSVDPPDWCYEMKKLRHLQ